ncbi:hypothetical protein Acr_22g0006920 [Actinidia rufa]|uniref:Retrotransposon gag domain-containing protein n=1 Tax=Actinidia rufa TaxID=165716 RepID=A0A7J0GKP8_9ERIC|nr:hypothetical protein Acr_22g0006920 [Actinidia rufa]
MEPGAMEHLMKLINDMSVKIDQLQDEVRTSHVWLGALEESMQQTPHTPQGENFCMGGNREGHKSHLDQITMIILIQGTPKFSNDWFSEIDHFFDWHKLSNDKKVRFAQMKLIGRAKLSWQTIEQLLARRNQPAITDWVETKEKLKEKYLPLSYQAIKVSWRFRSGKAIGHPASHCPQRALLIDEVCAHQEGIVIPEQVMFRTVTMLKTWR